MAIIELIKNLYLKNRTPNSADVAKLLSEAEVEHDAALARVASLEGDRADAVLAGQGEQHRELLVSARHQAEDAAEVIEALRKRHTEAERGQAEARRAEQYIAAREMRESAAARLRAEYSQHIAGLRDLLRVVTADDLAIEVANKDLPAGALALGTVEGEVRDRPSVPARILAERQLEAWVEHGDRPPARDQSDIADLGGGKGHKKIPTGHGLLIKEYRRENGTGP
ncbi:hypothetical protein ACLBXM_13765 [Xanthobacteraceae bacterium A53D]